MNKTLLISLFALALSAQAIAQTKAAIEPCVPINEWQSYACISSVEMNGMINDSDPGVPGETLFGEDFRGDASKHIKLVAGQTYELKITFSNFNSGPADYYWLRTYFDWNNDCVYSAEETHSMEILAGRQGGFVRKTFNITVPADAATGLINMRVFTFYQTTDPNYSGDDPCGLVESGQYEDYMVEISGTSNVDESQITDFSVYPVPTRDELFINGITASQYQLYSIDGKLVRSGIITDNKVNVLGMQSGMYILKMQTNSGARVANIIIE